ncbi:hypothetical protein C8Q77DRAFT_1070779 [Trametes polyzona]|nr:hypothetical protein C8Q77DRAFT_1070779 [Trametes polyzona]
MNTRRRSTVHDLAALRLHRDGTRVLNSDTNRSSRRAKYAVHDSRGNWIARDAGGLANVKQRRSRSRLDDEDEAPVPEEDEGLLEDPQSSPRKSKGKGRAREGNDSEEELALRPKARKRRRFDEDLSYLTSASGTALVPPADIGNQEHRSEEHAPGTLPVPSSDLLKCLHYFASTYYTAMGQLYDGSREFRKQKKARRLEKASRASEAVERSREKSEGAGSHEAPHNSSEDELDPSDHEDEGPADDHPAPQEGSSSAPQAAGKARKRKGPRRVRPLEKDMYKVFDGSALVALGMLFQEHVAEMVQPRIPETWDKEIAEEERRQRARARKARKAKEMWMRRHPGKRDSEAPGDDELIGSQSEDEVGGSETDSYEDEDLASVRHSTVKENSSVPPEGIDGSDD